MRVHERRCGSTNSCGERRTDIIFFSPMGRHYSNSSWPSLTGNPFLMIVWCVVSLCVVVWVGVGGVFFAQMSAPSQAQGAADQDVIDVTHTRAHCPTTNNNRATHATTTSPQHFHHSAAAAAAASVAEDPLSLSPLPFLSKDAVQSHNYIFTAPLLANLSSSPISSSLLPRAVPTLTALQCLLVSPRGSSSA